MFVCVCVTEVGSSGGGTMVVTRDLCTYALYMGSKMILRNSILPQYSVGLLTIAACLSSLFLELKSLVIAFYSMYVEGHELSGILATEVPVNACSP